MKLKGEILWYHIHILVEQYFILDMDKFIQFSKSLIFIDTAWASSLGCGFILQGDL